MQTEADLELIHLADCDPQTAREAIVAALHSGDVRRHEKVYEALRAWLWIALDSRRRDDSLREWHDLMKRTQAFIAAESDIVAAKIHTLSELIFQSVRVSQCIDSDAILRRSHTMAILTEIAKSPENRAMRDDIGRAVGLRQANLTRVLNILVISGLVRRSVAGRSAIFELTDHGKSAASRIGIQVLAESSEHELGAFPADSLRGEVSPGNTVFQPPRVRVLRYRTIDPLQDSSADSNATRLYVVDLIDESFGASSDEDDFQRAGSSRPKNVFLHRALEVDRAHSSDGMTSAKFFPATSLGMGAKS